MPILTDAQQEMVDDATHAITRAVIAQYKDMVKAVGQENAPRFMLGVLMTNAVQVALMDKALGDATGALDGVKFAAAINGHIQAVLHQMTLN
jgi:hypothetical protein